MAVILDIERSLRCEKLSSRQWLPFGFNNSRTCVS